jgi:hypothetical protein
MRENWWFLAVALGLLSYGGYCLVRIPMVQNQVVRLPRMTCDQLVQSGPGPHRYVILTDACLSSRKSVSERDGETGHLELYHPFYAAHLPQEPAPRELALVLCIMDEAERRRIRDERDHRKRLGQPGLGELTGEVKKRADQLQPWVRDGLAAKYPGIQLATCWVVTVGQDEPTANSARQLTWYGIGSVLVAGAMIFGWGVRRRNATRGGKIDGPGSST